jgi:hypothetical protein
VDFHALKLFSKKMEIDLDSREFVSFDKTTIRSKAYLEALIKAYTLGTEVWACCWALTIH